MENALGRLAKNFEGRLIIEQWWGKNLTFFEHLIEKNYKMPRETGGGQYMNTYTYQEKEDKKYKRRKFTKKIIMIYDTNVIH